MSQAVPELKYRSRSGYADLALQDYSSASSAATDGRSADAVLALTSTTARSVTLKYKSSTVTVWNYVSGVAEQATDKSVLLRFTELSVLCPWPIGKSLMLAGHKEIDPRQRALMDDQWIYDNWALLVSSYNGRFIAVHYKEVIAAAHTVEDLREALTAKNVLAEAVIVFVEQPTVPRFEY